MKTKDRIKASWKYCTSFLRSDWRLKDYPISITELKPDASFESTERKQFRYIASIPFWGVAAEGNSKKDAVKALEEAFEKAKIARKKEGKPIPRPGTEVPIEFAAQELINEYPELADDFIRRILEKQWVWMSDESSLWDFHHDQNNDGLIAKIKDIYCVDVSDIQSAKLWEIFERIATDGKNIPGGSGRDPTSQ
jgi:hypothetical protein